MLQSLIATTPLGIGVCLLMKWGWNVTEWLEYVGFIKGTFWVWYKLSSIDNTCGIMLIKVNLDLSLFFFKTLRLGYREALMEGNGIDLLMLKYSF